MDMDTKKQIARQAAQAVHEYTHRFAVSLVDFQNFDIASGTILNVQGKLVIATAAHVMPALPNGRLILLGTHPHRFGDGSPAILRHGYNGKRGADIGFLEIEHAALDWLGKEALSVDSVEDMACGNAQMFTALAGFPGTTVGEPIKAGQVVPQYTSFALMPIPATEFNGRVVPVPAADATPDAQRDAFLEIPGDGLRRWDTYEKITTPDIGGTSGGGYFTFGNFAKDQLWTPQSLRMYAIQSSCHMRETNSYARGTQIVYLMKLLADSYPELAGYLRAKFPRIGNIP